MHVDAGVPGNVRQGYHRREETRLALAFRVRVRPGRSGIYASRRGNARISRASVCGTTPRYRTSRKMVSRIVDRYRERRAMRTCQIVLPGMSTGQHRASSHDSAHSRGHPHQTARQNQDGAVRLAEKLNRFQPTNSIVTYPGPAENPSFVMVVELYDPPPPPV